MDFFSRDQLVQVLAEAKGMNLSGCNHERVIGISVSEFWMGREELQRFWQHKLLARWPSM